MNYATRNAMAADDAGYRWDSRTRQYIDPEDWCPQCETGRDECKCERRVETDKVVTARKARPGNGRFEVRPGDRVLVTSGFTYEPNGPRTGYFHHYERVRKGPAWAN